VTPTAKSIIEKEEQWHHYEFKTVVDMLRRRIPSVDFFTEYNWIHASLPELPGGEGGKTQLSFFRSTEWFKSHISTKPPGWSASVAVGSYDTITSVAARKNQPPALLPLDVSKSEVVNWIEAFVAYYNQDWAREMSSMAGELGDLLGEEIQSLIQ